MHTLSYAGVLFHHEPIREEERRAPNMNTMQHRLSHGTLQHLAVLVDQLHLTNHFSGDALLQGADPIIRSPHRLGEATATAQLLIGIAGAAIWNERTGQHTDV